MLGQRNVDGWPMFLSTWFAEQNTVLSAENEARHSAYRANGECYWWHSLDAYTVLQKCHMHIVRCQAREIELHSCL